MKKKFIIDRINLKIFSLFSLIIISLSFYLYNFDKVSNFQKESMNLKEDLLSRGKFKCCIKEICTYCLIEEGECMCADSIVNGKAPCAECVGEILEGEGNPYLREYFVDALVEELGEENREFIQNIIKDKYY